VPDARASNSLSRIVVFKAMQGSRQAVLLSDYAVAHTSKPTKKCAAEPAPFPRKCEARNSKAIKTILLCRYLHSKELRREINEGLNVIEQWNGATDFVFFARRGEMVSNRAEDHEISMLALHLIQNCMVYRRGCLRCN
jgi:Tn3 transposase DDE domain